MHEDYARSSRQRYRDFVRDYKARRLDAVAECDRTRNLDANGFFRSAEQLKSMYTGHNIPPEKEAIPYCQGGYRAAHTYLALRLIGYPRVRTYLGSWNEWGNRPDLPIEVAE